MKFFPVIVLLAFWHSSSAQKLTTDYGSQTSGYTMAYNLLHDKFDTVIAYTTEGYWQSNNMDYYILANNDGEYFKGRITAKRKKDKSWTSPLVSFKKVNRMKAEAIVKRLQESGLWVLNVDSLNNQIENKPDGTASMHTLSDGVSYRFELIQNNKLLSIEAYAPEYFNKVLPQYKQRDTFIKIRGEFLKDYSTL